MKILKLILFCIKTFESYFFFQAEEVKSLKSQRGLRMRLVAERVKAKNVKRKRTKRKKKKKTKTKIEKETKSKTKTKKKIRTKKR